MHVIVMQLLAVPALRYDIGGVNLILVNYETVGSVLDELCVVVSSATFLIFDEVHKVKKVGGEYANAALQLAEKAAQVVVLTGTPIPNSYLDVYNLLHILYPDEYDEFFGFSVPVLRNPTERDIAQVNRKLQPFFCRTTKEQLGVPSANADIIQLYAANATENRLLHLLQMKYRRSKLSLFLRVLQLETNPRLLLERLELKDFQYLLDDSMEADEIDYADYSDEIQQLIEHCPPATKFVHCVAQTEALVEADKPVIIWCIFVQSIHALAGALEAKGIATCCVYGAVSLNERQQILQEFKEGHIQVLLTNPHTLAESVSLHSVCHDAIYYEYSYNLVHLLQSKDRIHRLGLPPEQYTQYVYLQVEYQTEDGPWSLSSLVYQRLKEKEQTMIDAIDCSVLETLPTSQEDLEMIFKPLFQK